MKTRIIGLCFYQLIIITLTTSRKSICYNTDKCSCYEESSEHYEYYCGPEHPDYHLVVDVTQSSETKFIKMYCFGRYEGRNYIEWIQDLYELPIKQVKIVLQQCPLPNAPFNNIFNVFGAENVTDFTFMMTTPFPGSKTTTFEPYHFANLTSLEVLHLSYNGIEKLSDNLFTDMVNLKGLHLHGNNLRSLPVKIFEPLKKLRELSLFENQLTSLDGKILQNSSKLRKLNLGKNKLDNLTKPAFDSLIGLRTLELSENNMTILNDGIFDNLKNLKILDLSKNKLIRVPDRLFSNGSKLETLLMRSAFDMEKNFTFPFPRTFFIGLKSLKTINVEGNNISMISQSFTFRGILISM